MGSTLQFLNHLYSLQCEQGDYIILSVKGPGVSWRDVPIRYGPKLLKDLTEFFSTYPAKEYDLYFSPMPYSGPRRRIENSLDTKFLAQDIDEHDNPDELDPAPSYIWESSPNKYQGLWELDRYIEEPEYTPLNKSLAEHLGCDDCFDFTHVYRIPGTINHKYKNKPEVTQVKESKKIYKPKNLQRKVGATQPREQKQPTEAPGGSDLTERKIYAKYTIPKDIRGLLALDDLTGVDRSNMIWYIENKLYEIGMTPNEIIHLVRNSAFNKYKGRHDEVRRLKKELEKIISGDISPKQSKDIQPLKVSSFMDVMSNPNTFEGWLVKGFWGKRSHGIVAGMPKTLKSTLVHDLIVSVASGTPFLGKYPVLDPGPVLVVQNENADYVMKDRTEKLILHRGLGGIAEPIAEDAVRLQFPGELPISFINQQGFLLSSEEHRAALEALIKEQQPVLVVLDPLYLMFDEDLNSAKDLNPVLNWLLYLKNEYKTSVMLIHHYNKGSAGVAKGGPRMMGSVILYGWIESAWYLSKDDVEEAPTNQSIDSSEVDTSSKEPTKVTMNREFRMAGVHPEIDIHVQMGGIGDPYYDVDVTLTGEPTVSKSSLKKDIINLLKQRTGEVSRREIVDSLGVSVGEVRATLDEMVVKNEIMSNDKGFTVYKGYGK